MGLQHGQTTSTMLSCRKQTVPGPLRANQGRISRRCGSIPRCRPFLPLCLASTNISSQADHHHHHRTEGVITIPCRLRRLLHSLPRDMAGITGPVGRPERRFTRDGRAWTGSCILMWRLFRGFLLGTGNNHRSSKRHLLSIIITRDTSSSINTKGHR